MCTHGRTTPFVARDWREIEQFLDESVGSTPGFGHLTDIVRSVIASGRSEALAGCTSMHDILVVPRPVPEPPYGVVVVRAPSSLRRAPRAGNVVIEEQSVTGHDDIVERPAAEAVPLFWRFMIEKFGIAPA
ncbi:hypothetical protein [Jiangella alba]|uniref:Uncharacterized protein n=1 Tax=Jiangella alba TaxID=561176 RepID=A0A1H5MWU7_9ACTN|nr:hypothetical protein [Jiangella alba]SEE93763.1 hypothetical protein SAMN04488561_3493 [Jiangella alba]